MNVVRLTTFQISSNLSFSLKERNKSLNITAYSNHVKQQSASLDFSVQKIANQILRPELASGCQSLEKPG